MKMQSKATFLIAAAFFLFVGSGVHAQLNAPPETRNAALRYWLAFAEMKDPPTDPATQDLLEKTAMGRAPWDENKLGPILDANAEALAIFQRATKLPDCDWGVEYSQGPSASIAYVPRARALARLNTLQGMRQISKGDSQAAVDTWLAGIRFTDHLAKGGSLIFALTAENALLPDLRALTAAANQGLLSPSQKQQLLTVIRSLPQDGFDWARAWEIDGAGSGPFFTELQHAKDPVAFYVSLVGEPKPETCIPPTSQEVRAYENYILEVAAALRLPPSAASQKLNELDSKAALICEPIRRMVPKPQHVNDARTTIVNSREALLQALQTK
jgi:hypothetical protein